MELIPFLIFAFIAFNIFKGFIKASPSAEKGESPKDLMQRLHAQIESDNRNTSPTQRGRETQARKTSNTPWGENGGVSPGAGAAKNYIQKTASVARIASHKNPKQTGRRGENVDQNRHRSDGWGERGDDGLFSGTSLIVLLVVGAAIIFALSQIPAN